MRTFRATCAGNASRAGSKDTAGEAGFRAHGKPEDSRDDLPQVIVGMAVTRDGIPVRVWSWPGNTADSGLIRQVKADLRAVGAVEGHLGRRPRLHLRGEPPRPDAGRRRVHHRREAPLRLPGGEGRPVPPGTLQDRPGQPPGQGSPPRRRRPTGSSSATTRTRQNATPPSAPGSSRSSRRSSTAPTPSPPPSAAGLEGTLAGRPGLKRFLRVTPAGLLRVDKARIKAEENLDGKYLLRCSDPHMTTEDIALGLQAAPAKSSAAGET